MKSIDGTIPLIQNSFAAGEITPNLYGRTDLAKFHQGCFTMRNFFVDYRGGASSRPGTQFIGKPAGTGAYARLWPFKFSATVGQTYILVFSNLLLEFIKNPGGNTYPNSSNSGFILDTGVHYSIATPYVEADIPLLKFSQTGDVLTITHPSYPRKRLIRVSDTSWTLSDLGALSTLDAPSITGITISGLPSGSTDPQTTHYLYAVSAVDANGVESPPSFPSLSSGGIDIGATQGSVTVIWGAVDTASYYKVWKALPASGDQLPSWAQPMGFAGFTYGTSFTDSNVIADFTKTPLLQLDPFAQGQIVGYTINSPGSDYTVGQTTITPSGGGGTGLIIYPIMDAPSGVTAGISGLYIASGGQNYTSQPTLTVNSPTGSGFDATLTIGPSSGTYPGVCGLFQQRQIYAATPNNPNAVFGSRPGALNDFRVTNPVSDDNAYTFNIANQQVTTIVWVQSMPGGLVLGTDAGILQLTGGSASASNPLAVTPQSAVIVPQSYYGAADGLMPIVIDYDILYIQSEGSLVRDLQYNFFVNIYTGTDITVVSSHLFYPRSIVAWAYQDTPNKVVWAIRDDGILLSLTYLKSQEIMGWARQDTTNGNYESVAVVQEGTTDAVYFSVNRAGSRCIERLCDRIYTMVDDAWCLDCALSTTPTFPAASVSVTADGTVNSGGAIFSAGDVGKVFSVAGGRGVVASYTSTTIIKLDITPGYSFRIAPYAEGEWRLDPIVSVISDLDHLENQAVTAFVDGKPQGPFTVSGGEITLTTPGAEVVVGLGYSCQLQPVYVDTGEPTTQGARKKAASVSVRVLNAAGLKYGPDFSHLIEWEQGTSSTDPQELLPYNVPGLDSGDERLALNQWFNRIGSVAIQLDDPYPATILATIPEISLGS